MEFVLGARVHEIEYAGGRVTGVRVAARDGGRERVVTAGHYVCALPVEHARTTWGPALRAADPRLARCDALTTDWMTGVMFHLRAPVPVVHGHVNCLDSPWPVTAGRATAAPRSSRSGTSPASWTAGRQDGRTAGRHGSAPRTSSSPSSGPGSRTGRTTPGGRSRATRTGSAGSRTRR
ncbi:hypothetical protein ACIF8T_30200 [Streptomyces sp. NPDC085946]|uniref:hypothetical protein n=1 Tax=Streptomyces sp. NPDC085946 TaxID=3365744 RepID=UPI0037D842B7